MLHPAAGASVDVGIAVPGATDVPADRRAHVVVPATELDRLVHGVTRSTGWKVIAMSMSFARISSKASSAAGLVMLISQLPAGVAEAQARFSSPRVAARRTTLPLLPGWRVTSAT